MNFLIILLLLPLLPYLRRKCFLASAVLRCVALFELNRIGELMMIIMEEEEEVGVEEEEEQIFF